jgi:acetyl-CoA C-acetyltransferase
MKSVEKGSYIYSAVRTPIGKFNGALAAVSAVDLAAIALREALLRSGVPAEAVDEVILGNVLSAGLGQHPARQAAIKGGLPFSVRAVLVNEVCGSGLRAVMLADQAVRLGEAEFVAAGGMESMSQSPHLLKGHRRGRKLGDDELIDSLILDGLCDGFLHRHMGEIAEAMARRDGITRAEQDRYALQSYTRARTAQDRCWFAEEIVAVPVPGQTGEVLVDEDETPRSADLAKLPGLPPAFVKEGGTITAGNASKINDGAAVLVVGRYDAKLRPLARIVAQAGYAGPPEEFPIAPVAVIRKVLQQWGVGLAEIDLFEINEAFAASTLAVVKRLELSAEKVNVQGGAVALGHPIGASGARILVTLIHAMRRRNARNGIVAICLGGGEALALGIEVLGRG